MALGRPHIAAWRHEQRAAPVTDSAAPTARHHLIYKQGHSNKMACSSKRTTLPMRRQASGGGQGPPGGWDCPDARGDLPWREAAAAATTLKLALAAPTVQHTASTASMPPPADAPLPAPPELRAAAMGAMQQLRRQRQAAGSWSTQEEEDYRIAAMVLSGRWRL